MINLRDDSGEVGEIVITVIMSIVAMLIFTLYPTLTTAEQNEKVTQLAVQKITSDLANGAAKKGTITRGDYDQTVQQLSATGNTFDIQIEIQHLDTNMGDKTAVSSGSLVGNTDTYSTFLSSIQSNPGYTSGKGYPLKKGDVVIVTVKNTNTTIAQLLRRFFYQITGQGTYTIGATATAMVVNNGGY